MHLMIKNNMLKVTLLMKLIKIKIYQYIIFIKFKILQTYKESNIFLFIFNISLKDVSLLNKL